MKYILVKPDGTLGQEYNFEGQPPVIAPNKGRWLPATLPTHDTATQEVTPLAVQPAGVHVIQYEVKERDAVEVEKEARKRKEKEELENVKQLPLIKQFSKLSRTEVIDLVQAAFPAGEQRDLVKLLALVAWTSVIKDTRD